MNILPFLLTTLLFINLSSPLSAQGTRLISEIQGNGETSPLVGSVVAVEGIVVEVFLPVADDRRLEGFFLVEELDDRDSDPETSEGIFVYAPDADSQLRPGDVVRVSGRVVEYRTGGSSSLTELSGVSSILRIDTGPVPDPVSIFFPSDLERLESFEGMNVRIVSPMVVVENYNLDRYGEVSLALIGEGVPTGAERPVWPTMYREPGAEAAGILENATRDRIVLDDGSTDTWPIRGPAGASWDRSTIPFGGDVIEGMVGVLDDRFGSYRLHPTAESNDFSGTEGRPDPPRFAGEADTTVVRVASFNVGNYFLTLSNGESGCGPGQNLDCRGAETLEERDRQEAKLVSAIDRLDADIVALVEIENTPDIDPAGRLAEIVSARASEEYAPIITGIIGTDAIRCGFIYRTSSVEPVGQPVILDRNTDPRFNDRSNRPSIAQRFRSLRTGGTMTVVVNHFKSKGSPCDALDDPDRNDGQGNCSETRRLAAEALAEWVERDLSTEGDRDVLIVGDFNAYAREDAILELEEAGLARLSMEKSEDSIWNDYTYSFDGLVGSLDHVLVTASLVQNTLGAASWHINADAPDLLDYRTGEKSAGQIARIDGTPFRSSDHDPIVIAVRLGSDSGKSDVDEIPGYRTPLDLVVAPIVTKLSNPMHHFNPVSLLFIRSEHR